MPPFKSCAILFGLNYAHEPSATLKGCINDVQNMATVLKTEYPNMTIEVLTDDTNRSATSAQGIIQKLFEIAISSYRESLDFVYIHYSGHGSYVKDVNNDECDGQDECLVPSDFRSAGLISDDVIQSLFRNFNPKTRVVCVFDCCHSGTIGDLSYSWDSPTKCTKENKKVSAIKAKIVTISGCLDSQTSADAFNVLGNNKYEGALTSCLLLALKEKPSIRTNIFEAVTSIRNKLKEKGFAQYPKLCSSHMLDVDPICLPAPF